MLKKLWQKIKDAITFPFKIRAMLIELYEEEKENEEICDKILKEFGLETKNSHIINGHVPVKEKDGESPIKANGKLLVIDRRICKKL